MDTDSEDNWGTILLAGLNLGGKSIWAEGDYDDGSGVTVSETRDFYPSYVLMDITDPRNPRLLWERTYQGIGLTTSMPAVVRVKDKWFAVFGSGPTDYEGNSNQKAHVFVVDLKTGDAYPNSSFASGTTNAWLFESIESASFMNSPVALDKELNNNVDAVYFGEAYKQGADWKGKAYKVFIEWDWIDLSTYIDNPNDGTDPWTFEPLFDSSEPITAKMNLSADIFDNIWVYFGTGRYIGNDDKTTTDTQYLYGLVDPFFNKFYDGANGDYYHNYSSTLELDINDLFDADPYVITTIGDVFIGSTFFGTFDDLVDAARIEDGWFRTLTTSKERNVTQLSILGGIAFAPTFVPNSDICGFGGDSSLYALYFETGTPFFESVFETDVEVINIAGDPYQKVTGKIDLGQGKSSGLGFHVGSEEGAKAFVQQSTGEVLEIDTNPAFEIQSGLINWKEK